MDALELLNRYISGEREFGAVNLSEADFRGMDLRCIRLKGATLKRTYFAGADLRGAVLTNASLDFAGLEGAYLSGADLSGARLLEASFHGTKLCGCYMKTNHGDCANFEGADLRGAILPDSCFKFASFKGADLRGAQLQDSNLRNTFCAGADFRGADLTGCDLGDADLTNADFRGAGLLLSNLAGAKLEGALLDENKNIGERTEDSSNTTSSTKEPDVTISDKQPINNQGIQYSQSGQIYTWQGLKFRSQAEIKIAEAFDKTGVFFLPNCLGRLNDLSSATGRGKKEADFLVCHQGKWGVLEVDGPYHTPERRVEEQKRERIFKLHGVRLVERYDAVICYNTPDDVVRQFLQMLEDVYK